MCHSCFDIEHDSRSTLFVFTQVHCMLTIAAACSFLARPHWITACLVMLYVPKAINKLTIKLAHFIQHAIQSFVKKPKQSKFPQPRIRNGAYWRRIRNKTRQLHKHSVYRYIKVLCWHHFIQQSTPQQPKCSKQHVSQPEKELPTHMQGEAKCDKTGDSCHSCRNGATQHAPDHHRNTHTQKCRAARTHHRMSANAVIYTRNKAKQKKHTSTIQPCPHEMNDAQMTCVVPAKVLCINAPSCCRHALNNRQMTYSGTIDFNTTREETTVLKYTYSGDGQQPNIPDGELDLGPNNDVYTPFSGSGCEWQYPHHNICAVYAAHEIL